MQNDLISRAEVLKMLKACLSGGESQYNYVKLHIDSIPTVYNVEKVDEQINTYFDKTYALVGTDCKDITVRACILSILRSVKEIINLYIRNGGKE